MSNSPSSNASTAIDTIQSLIVAFVIAMIFRGFVVEGFVIPTGSMAPTLLGQHMLIESGQTGSATPVGLDAQRKPDARNLRDHLAGRLQPFRKGGLQASSARMGDRLLVAKWLYPFMAPERFDVVVFKNPVHPDGASGTYIKRLIGLPGEAIWIVDGDVFIRKLGEDRFHVARKERDVRETVWQLVWDSEQSPTAPALLPKGWTGLPWIGSPKSDWKETGHVLESTSDAPAILDWDNSRFPLDDWNSYNMFTPITLHYAVSDLRVSATLTPENNGLSASMLLTTRGHVFRFAISGDLASIEMWPKSRPAEVRRVEAKVGEFQGSVPRRFVAEHIDQVARLLIDGNEVANIAYDWTPEQRMEFATGTKGAKASELARRLPDPPTLQWSFDGSPVRVANMQVERDLYYRPATISASASMANQPTPEFADRVKPGQPAAATHPDSLITLGPDQFFMLGDNSARSLDGRLWGAPAPIVAEQVDPTPFVVNRDLLIGKAFVVYFPAPLSGAGPIPIPDFGRLRFIH
ncbi:MAG: S26 family signal peptidase [Phycisphaerales bacterium]|nr:S26 family signal peptidase [Phycisphaerales bacterium]